jgi:putative flippase GtrA
MKKLIMQLIRFGIVGVIATAIDVGVLALLKEAAHMEVLVASALSFTVAVVVNYILSMLWVFKSKGESKAKEFVIFVLLSVGGLLITQLVMWLGTELAEIYYLAVKIFAIIFESTYNFITRKIFLEKKAP